MIIDGIYKTFSFTPAIWNRKPIPLERDEFAVALGLGLAPWLAIRDLIHPDSNVWAAAAVFAAISILSLTSFGAAASLALNSWRRARLREVKKFACLFCHLNFYVGAGLLMQRFDLLGEKYSPANELFDIPTPITASLKFNVVHVALPVVFISLIGWRKLQRSNTQIRRQLSSSSSHAKWVDSFVRRQQISFWLVMTMLLICTLFQMDVLLWRILPNWVIPTIPG